MRSEVCDPFAIYLKFILHRYPSSPHQFRINLSDPLPSRESTKLIATFDGRRKRRSNAVPRARKVSLGKERSVTRSFRDKRASNYAGRCRRFPRNFVVDLAGHNRRKGNIRRGDPSESSKAGKVNTKPRNIGKTVVQVGL